MRSFVPQDDKFASRANCDIQFHNIQSLQCTILQYTSFTIYIPYNIQFYNSTIYIRYKFLTIYNSTSSPDCSGKPGDRESIFCACRRATNGSSLCGQQKKILGEDLQRKAGNAAQKKSKKKPLIYR